MEQRWQRRSTDTGRVETMREGNYLSAVRDLRARLRCTQRSPLLPKMTSPVNQRASKADDDTDAVLYAGTNLAEEAGANQQRHRRTQRAETRGRMAIS